MALNETMAEQVHMDCILVFYCKFCRQAFLSTIKLNQHAELKHADQISSFLMDIFQNYNRVYCAKCKIPFLPEEYDRHFALHH